MQLKIAPNVLMRDARDRYLAANDLSMEEYTASTCTIGLCGIRLKLPNTKVRQRPCPCTISTNAFSMKLLAEAYTRTGAMAEADAEVKKLTGLNNSDHRSGTRRASC